MKKIIFIYIVLFIFLLSNISWGKVNKFYLGTKADYESRDSDIVYGKKNASYIIKKDGRYSFLNNGNDESNYKKIQLLTYSDDKDSYAYVGINKNDDYTIIYNGKKIRHSMDKITKLSLANNKIMYIGEKKSVYSVYINNKKVASYDEIIDGIMLNDGSLLICIKENNSYKILLNDIEIKNSCIPVMFYRHKNSVVILYSESESANNKSISIVSDYKKLKSWDIQTFDDFNRIGKMYFSENGKSFVIQAYKTSGSTSTIIANGKIYDDITKINDVIFSANGLRYLINVKKSDGHYVIGDNDEFGPYSNAIVDMAFSADSLVWGFLGSAGSRTAIVIDGEGYKAYYYADDLSLSKNGKKWLLNASHDKSKYFIDFNALQTSKKYDRIYSLDMSDSGKRVGFVFKDGNDINISIDDKIIKYKGSKKYPFIAITDKSYIATSEDEGKYTVIFNNASNGSYDKFYVSPTYIEETFLASWIALEGDEVYLYEAILK